MSEETQGFEQSQEVSPEASSEGASRETSVTHAKIEYIRNELTTLAKRMKPKMLRYAEAYVETGVAARAARAAGYSEKTVLGSAGRPLKNELVARYISLTHELTGLLAGTSSDWFLSELKDLYEKYKGDPARAAQAVRCLELIGEYQGYTGKGARGKESAEGFVRMPPPPANIEEWRREMVELGYIPDEPIEQVYDDTDDPMEGLPEASREREETNGDTSGDS